MGVTDAEFSPRFPNAKSPGEVAQLQRWNELPAENILTPVVVFEFLYQHKAVSQLISDNVTFSVVGEESKWQISKHSSDTQGLENGKRGQAVTTFLHHFRLKNVFD
ncbi:hypothetical protein KIN20_020248 [Parelaphostrongylus tenuis]|uniref:Uncharacterized protein n=1 Tax=Parelaphostrongylus tenuis TaxID=148309 RepID=A0AAD5N311_PARTN|nr:hypothetical protein KIN20_020248 [Parelaphostrongylus tenuis]